MKIVRVLLFLVLLAGEYRLHSASVEAHYTPLMAANRQNLLCATNVLLLDKRMTIVGTLLAATMMINLKTVRRSCVWPWDANTSGTMADSEEPPPSQESSASPMNIIHACASILYVCVPIDSIIAYTAVNLRRPYGWQWWRNYSTFSVRINDHANWYLLYESNLLCTCSDLKLSLDTAQHYIFSDLKEPIQYACT